MAATSAGESCSVKSWKMKPQGGFSAPPHGLVKPISSLPSRRTRLPLPTLWALTKVPFAELSSSIT